MSVGIRIVDASGSSTGVTVTTSGELVVGPISYDQTKHVELAEPNTPYTFYPPLPGEQFVITGLTYSADAQVSPVDTALIEIYEASAPDTLVVDKELHVDEMVRGDRIPIFPLRVLVSVGKHVNAKTTDDDIHMTITGYYIKAIE